MMYDTSDRAPYCLSKSLFGFEIDMYYSRKKSKIPCSYNSIQYCIYQIIT